MKAKFVSVWDNGDNVFESVCDFDPIKKEVSNVESIDVDDVELFYVDDQYIELPGGEIIKDFFLDGVEFKDGQSEE